MVCEGDSAVTLKNTSNLKYTEHSIINKEASEVVPLTTSVKLANGPEQAVSLMDAHLGQKNDTRGSIARGWQ